MKERRYHTLYACPNLKLFPEEVLVILDGSTHFSPLLPASTGRSWHKSLKINKDKYESR